MKGVAELEDRVRRCRPALEDRGQGHLLRWWHELTLEQRHRLLTETEAIPWDLLDPVIPTHVLRRPTRALPAHLAPADVLPCIPLPGQEHRHRQAAERGRELIRAGRVAALTVAGGQGTRLGFDGPKGCLQVTPVGAKTLFQLFAETIRATRDRFGTAIPWYVMTSPENHAQTLAYLRRERFFGLPEGDVVLFQQSVLPLFSFDGSILMTSRHTLALGPDGHGGSLKALVGSGALNDMKARGVTLISYFQVDNPLVKPIDPLFIGLHAETGAEMSVKVTPKVDDLERVGNVCLADGKVTVIEYSELPLELARARRPDGRRLLDAANLAIHLIDVAFVERVIGRSFQMPFRRADKAVAHLDPGGTLVQAAEPNAVKLETFVFDVLPLARFPLVFQVERAEEFSPIKNALGLDSLETTRRDQIRRACRWLEAAGVLVPRRPDGAPDVTIAIAPSFALDASDVINRRANLPALRPGDALLLE